MNENHVKETRLNVIRHRNLYFEYGDIVVLSRPTDGVATAFKVDKAYLRRWSSAFSSMLLIPPPQHIETFDDIPVVRLEDESDDLEALFEIIYHEK